MSSIRSPLELPEEFPANLTRPLLRDALLRRPTEPLYHYTTQKGLLGIICGEEIWATHNQYLNDTREFHHATDIFREELELLLRECDQPMRAGCLKLMQDSIPLATGFSSVNVCVASFSAEGDSLSQWRAYGGEAGFAIGFDPEFLSSVVRSQQFLLARCIYDPDEQRQLVRAVLGEVADEMERAATTAALGWPFGTFAAYMLRFAPLLKDKSFKDEREWRVITAPLSCQSKGFAFREGSSQIIPYYHFKLKTEEQRFMVSQIVVGPARWQESAMASVRSLLIQRDLLSSDEMIRSSRVPYRTR